MLSVKLVAAMSIVPTAVFGALWSKMRMRPVLPRRTSLAKLRRKGASRQTVAPALGKRLTTPGGRLGSGTAAGGGAAGGGAAGGGAASAGAAGGGAASAFEAPLVAA